MQAAIPRLCCIDVVGYTTLAQNKHNGRCIAGQCKRHDTNGLHTVQQQLYHRTLRSVLPSSNKFSCRKRRKSQRINRLFIHWYTTHTAAATAAVQALPTPRAQERVYMLCRPTCVNLHLPGAAAQPRVQVLVLATAPVCKLGDIRRIPTLFPIRIVRRDGMVMVLLEGS